jgi:hypothetical protein
VISEFVCGWPILLKKSIEQMRDWRKQKKAQAAPGSTFEAKADVFADTAPDDPKQPLARFPPHMVNAHLRSSFREQPLTPRYRRPYSRQTLEVRMDNQPHVTRENRLGAA